jgi:hypothetical protein
MRIGSHTITAFVYYRRSAVLQPLWKGEESNPLGLSSLWWVKAGSNRECVRLEPCNGDIGAESELTDYLLVHIYRYIDASDRRWIGCNQGIPLQ